MELYQHRDESHASGVARLLNEMGNLSRPHQDKRSDIADEVPEQMRKFLESYFTDRSGSIV